MWVTETAIPPMIICSIVAVVLFVQFYLRHQIKYIVGCLVMTGAIVGFYFLEQSIITERERVEADLYGLISAFENKEVEPTLSYFSPRAEGLAR